MNPETDTPIDTADNQTDTDAVLVDAPPAIHEPVQKSTGTLSAVDTRLQNVTNLVQALMQDQEVKSLLCLLLELPNPNPARPD